jgi:hypothetical protein
MRVTARRTVDDRSEITYSTGLFPSRAARLIWCRIHGPRNAPLHGPFPHGNRILHETPIQRPFRAVSPLSHTPVPTHSYGRIGRKGQPSLHRSDHIFKHAIALFLPPGACISGKRGRGAERTAARAPTSHVPCLFGHDQSVRAQSTIKRSRAGEPPLSRPRPRIRLPYERPRRCCPFLPRRLFLAPPAVGPRSLVPQRGGRR